MAKILVGILNKDPRDIRLPYHWCVDSVNGSDSNTGKGPFDAFKTIAKLSTVLAAGETVGLACGSHWREQLTLPGSNCSVRTYSVGYSARPIIDGSNIISSSSFSKSGGYTNVYQATVTPEWTGTDYLNVWEDDIFLTRAADLAACDSTPGTYYPSASTGTITLYIHATGSGNPASNGKVYEYSHRARSIYAANSGVSGITINGVHTRRNLEQNGSIFLYKSSIVENCLIEDGSRHNLYIGEGSYLGDTTLRNAYFGTGSYSLLVCYSPTGTGLGFVCDNCACENTRGGVDSLGAGFYGHTTSGSLGLVAYSNITASNLGYGLDTGLSASSCTIDTFDASNCAYGINCSVDLTVSGYTHSIDTNKRSIQLGAGNTLNLSDSTITLTGTYTGGHIYSAYNNVTVNLDNVHFIDNDAQNIIFMSGTGSTIYARNCDFEKANRVYNIAATGSVDSDYNRFRDACQFYLNGTTYATIALWQSGTGNDTHSTIG